jgi:hypothetical protein
MLTKYIMQISIKGPIIACLLRCPQQFHRFEENKGPCCHPVKNKIQNLHNEFKLWINFSMAQQPPSGPGLPYHRDFMITLRHSTLGRTPLDK